MTPEQIGFRSLQLRSPAVSSDLAQLQAEVRDFVSAEIGSDVTERGIDTWLQASPEFSRKLGARGWIGMTWPKRYGGHERTSLERYIVTEELLAAGAPVGAHWIADRQTGPLLLRYGTDEQRERFLPGIAAGEIYFSIGMSEPDSGSDLASVRMKAQPDNGGWRLSGTKIWTSGAQRAHYMVTLCRTAKADDRHAGLSQLIVDLRSPGIRISPIHYMAGAHDFNEVVFEDVFVPREMLLGNEGDGWHQVTSELALERSGPERFLSTFPLLVALVSHLGASPETHEAIALGSLVAQLWTLRRMSMAVADEIDRGGAPAIEAALVKDLGTQFEGAVVEIAHQLAPSSARDPGGSLERLLQSGLLAKPGFTLRGGTTEILRTVVARGLGAT